MSFDCIEFELIIDIIDLLVVYRLKLGPNHDVSWGNIEKLLTSEGEVFSRDDLGFCLAALVGENTSNAEMASYDAEKFAEAILGFENFAADQPLVEVAEGGFHEI